MDTTVVDDSRSVSAETFRRFMGRWPTGVAVVGMLDDGVPCGMTVNSLMSVSLEPLLIAVSVCRGSRADRLLHLSAGFTVSFLTEGQSALATWFARGDRFRSPEGEFAGVRFDAAPGSGAPYVQDATGAVEGAVAGRVEAGDHTILIGRVERLLPSSGSSPLLFHRGRWSAVRPDSPPSAS